MSDKGIFVTGTDTGVGKTFVACLLARLLREKCRLGVMKPFASGSHLDVERLVHAAGLNDIDLNQVNPVYFDLPLAPYSADKFPKKNNNLSKVLNAYEWMKKYFDFIIVEGIGGLHVPLTHNLTVADLVCQMDLPMVVVTHPYSGTLNHTLLTLNYALQKKIKVAGLVINEHHNKRDFSRTSNVSALKRLIAEPLVGFLPYIKGDFGKKIERALKFNFINKHWLKEICNGPTTY